MQTRIVLLLLVVSGLYIHSCTDPLTVELRIDDSSTPVQIALEKLRETEREGGFRIVTEEADLLLNGTVDPMLTSEDAFRIEQDNNVVNITGGGATGLVYGIQQVRDELKRGNKDLTPADESPHYSFRALKFNLPWSSYRRSEALQLHYETCRDTLFWEKFLDMMVENRFNKLTLWNLHPFNYLVRVASYPEANDMTDDEFAEWKVFWSKLFRMAKDRGIETYLVNWNIFVSPEFASAHNVATYSIDGTYFTNGDTAAIIKDYTRESVRQVIDEYPDLTGLGITLGEAMFGMGAEQREKWLLDGYIQGVREASRKIKFIHRVPLTKGANDNSTRASVEMITRATLDTLTCFDGPIIIELKYNWSHGHSSPELFKVHGGELSDAYWNPIPTNYRLSWMVRNEDFFMLRWGQPEFIRQHITHNSQEYVAGYFVGSETYIPAVDYFTALEPVDWQYAFERQWMFYKQWGRLLYNPDTPDTYFSSVFKQRYPQYGGILFNAQTMAGRIPLIIGSYWNATWDYTLYSEGLLTHMGQKTTQLITVKQIAEKTPMDTMLMGVKEYLDLIERGGTKNERISPIELADSIELFCNRAIEMVSQIDPGNDNGLLYEKTDILTWSNLGLYFGKKLRCAVAYQKYLNGGEEALHREAVNLLEEAVPYWEEVSALTTGIYKAVPLQHYNRNEDKYFHWNKVLAEVYEELEWLKAQ